MENKPTETSRRQSNEGVRVKISPEVEKQSNANEGLRVNIKGRINGVPRSKNWVAYEGKMSLQCIDAVVDYSYLPTHTVYGTFGVKVWINYG